MARDLPDFSQRLPGGDLPPVSDLVSSVATDIVDDLGPYALAGLGLWGLNLIVVLVSIPFTYFLMVFGSMIAAFAGFGGGLGAGLLVGSVGGEDAGAATAVTLSTIFGVACPMMWIFCIIFGLISVLTLIFSPLQASMFRAVRAHQLGEKKLGIEAAFDTALDDLPIVIGTAFTLVGIQIGAILCFYFPVFFVGLFVGLAMPAVALHRQSPANAVMQSFNHVKDNLAWHLGFWALGIVVGFIAAYIPVIGPMVGFTYITKGYRAVFGDGDLPNETGERPLIPQSELVPS